MVGLVGVAGQRDDLVFWIWCLGGHSVNEGVFTRVWRVEAEGRRGGVFRVDGAPLEGLRMLREAQAAQRRSHMCHAHLVQPEPPPARAPRATVEEKL